MIVLPAPASSASRKRRSRLGQHVLVDGDALMRQRLNQREFRGESGVDEVAAGKAFSFGHDPHGPGIGLEIEYHGRFL